MGLFNKKPPCPICGGKISWLLPSKIEGEYICDTCHNKIDMEDDRKLHLSMQEFKEYLMFYEQNRVLKNKFVVSEKIDFGLWDTKIIFDYDNQLFCMSKNPDKTVFEGKQLKSFTIKEDSSLLFSGSANGMHRYASTVPECVMALAPQITQFMVSRQLARAVDLLNVDKDNQRPTQRQYFDVPEPFKTFNVELHFEHPYWNVLKCNMAGPRFSNERPNVNDYLNDYQRNIEEIEKLVRALQVVAFPNAAEQSIGLGNMASQPVHTFAAPPTDAIEEIKKYKSLMEEGIITREEFDAKKKQLLGI